MKARIDATVAQLPAKIPPQLEHELRIIEKLGFAGYFLIVWDIVNFCREQNIMVQGRGSAANSAVCFCLGITAVDAVKHELLFERFLSEGRKSWPDIDSICPAATGASASSRKFIAATGASARP